MMSTKQFSSSPLLQVKNLNKSFGAVNVARDLCVSLYAGEIVGIIGANGAGKTTFVNLITGYLRPTSGRIEFAGRDITGLSPRRIVRLGICRSFQVSQVFNTMTVFEQVLLALGVKHSRGLQLFKPLYRDDLIEKTHQLLIQYQLAAVADAPSGELAQGVRKLLDIVLAMVSEPRLLLLDEPTSGVSTAEKFALMDVIMQPLREAGAALVFIEHDMEIVRRYVQRVLAFYQGEIICDADCETALQHPVVQAGITGFKK